MLGVGLCPVHVCHLWQSCKSESLQQEPFLLELGLPFFSKDSAASISMSTRPPAHETFSVLDISRILVCDNYYHVTTFLVIIAERFPP